MVHDLPMTEDPTSDAEDDTTQDTDEIAREEVADGARPAATLRDPSALQAALAMWLDIRLGDGARPRITALEMPSANGMSSDTVLFDAEWHEGDARVRRRLVARIAPDDEAFPIFPSYELARQFDTIRLVGELSDVPVPEVLWLENDAGAIGSPFFVMARVDGLVPPDRMPYNFGSWLSEAGPEDQMHLQRATVDLLVRLHAIADPVAHFDFSDPHDDPASSPLRRHVAAQRRYYEWVTDGGERSPLIERGFEWLEANWPADEGPTVLNWGDARIGNVMYDGFEPVAVLDWEMAALGPPEIDLAWMIFLHRFFEDIASAMGLDGMADFMRRDDVAATYAERSGYTPRDLDWFTLYAALRHGIIMSRVTRRAVAFGEAEMPEDIDDLIMHRAALEAMLEGTYWSSLGL